MIQRLRSLFIFLVVFSSLVPAGAASLHCADIEAIVNEGIAYHLTGAPSSDLPNNCAKKMKWKYFDPNIEVRYDGDTPGKKRDYTWFDPKRDSYKLKNIRPSGAHFEVDVDFVINKKKIAITYTYKPNAVLEKHKGVCGTIDHKEKPWIFRVDCQK